MPANPAMTSTAHSQPASSSSHSSPATAPAVKTPDSSISAEQNLHPQSCVLCAQRKVKCDRRDPSCANCIRARVDCEYRAPLPRGPRKRKHLNETDGESSQALADKLARCEELLRTLGLSPDNVASGRGYAAHTHQAKAEVDGALMFPRGRLMSQDGRLVYVENTLWATVADEVPEHESETTDNQREAELAPSERADLLSFSDMASTMSMGLPMLSGRRESTNLEVPQDHANVFWDHFLTNVHPLSKIVHAPTVHKQHIYFINKGREIPKRIQALLAGVYLSGLCSMIESDCPELLGKTKRELILTYFPIVANAMVEARFLGTIDIETLQGLVFMLLVMRDKTDARTTWSLIGVAIRIAQYIGLHHDGDDLNVSPFEAEIRRRIWWQIGILEAAIGELSGFGPSTLVTSSATKPPTNLNDDDMDPNMKTLPPGRAGATDVCVLETYGATTHIKNHADPQKMMFVMLRTQAGNMARKHRLGSLFMGSWMKSTGSKSATQMLAQLINEMEEIVERDFLRYCDYLNPLHKLCANVSRVFLARLRLKMYQPRRKLRDGEPFTQEEKNFCYGNALKIVQYDNVMLEDPTLQRYRWHLTQHFQWDSFMFLFHDLRERDPFSSEAITAWAEVKRCFANHPEMLADQVKLLHITVGMMCLKAWDIKVAAHIARDPADPIATQPPAYISTLRSRQARREAQHRARLAREGRVIGDRTAPAPPATFDVELPNYMPSLSEGTMYNTALDGMMDMNFNFGIANDFDFTFEVPQGFSSGLQGGGAGGADWTDAQNMDFDSLWDGMFAGTGSGTGPGLDSGLGPAPGTG